MDADAPQPMDGVANANLAMENGGAVEQAGVAAEAPGDTAGD